MKSKAIYFYNTNFRASDNSFRTKELVFCGRGTRNLVNGAWITLDGPLSLTGNNHVFGSKSIKNLPIFIGLEYTNITSGICEFRRVKNAANIFALVANVTTRINSEWVIFSRFKPIKSNCDIGGRLTWILAKFNATRDFWGAIWGACTHSGCARWEWTYSDAFGLTCLCENNFT